MSCVRFTLTLLPTALTMATCLCLHNFEAPPNTNYRDLRLTNFSVLEVASRAILAMMSSRTCDLSDNLGFRRLMTRFQFVLLMSRTALHILSFALIWGILSLHCSSP